MESESTWEVHSILIFFSFCRGVRKRFSGYFGICSSYSYGNQTKGKELFKWLSTGSRGRKKKKKKKKEFDSKCLLIHNSHSNLADAHHSFGSFLYFIKITPFSWQLKVFQFSLPVCWTTDWLCRENLHCNHIWE